MSYISPLRYPGGKAGLTGFLTDVIDLNNLRGCSYYEPYAGGAGAALTLLKNEIISDISINDADERIYAFWNSVLNTSERFIDKIFSVPLNIEEWHRQNAICQSPNGHDGFDVGFAAFFMNRCNRSGIITGAGPIGGLEQAGKWKMGVRFNRETLATRISFLSRLRGRIRLSCYDAIEFLRTRLPRGNRREEVFVYLDPPYVNKGQQLYLNAYQQGDHAHLMRYLSAQRSLSWVVSYDDTELVRNLYTQHQVLSLPIRYSLQAKRTTSELIIAPHRLALPRSSRIHGREIRIQ
jgi:DNA adenine methylase